MPIQHDKMHAEPLSQAKDMSHDDLKAVNFTGCRALPDFENFPKALADH